ncbi:hypothetical protein SNEBB_009766 [Seison nebaliae]|nr:hypothetical protein SNEBB_009766 [Seison nebaliae]
MVLNLVLRKVFNEFDRDRSGTITKKEAEAAIKRYLYLKKLAVTTPLKAKIMTAVLFKIADKNRDGHITFEEFADVFKLF